MILLLSLTLPIILIIFYLLHKIKQPRALTTLPPGPPQLPLIGNLHQLGTVVDPHIYLYHLSKKYGPIMHMKLGSIPLLVISSAKLAKQVLKIQDLAFCSRPNLLGQQKLSYNSSDVGFTPYNDDFKEMKKMTRIHLLSNKRVQSYRPIREQEIAHMITNISTYSPLGQELNLSEVAMAANIHMICGIVFGKRYEEGGSEMKRFLRILEEYDVLVTSFFVSDYLPAFGLVDKISGRVKRADVMCKGMDEFYQELIDEHLESRRVKKKMEEVEDMLDVLIKLKNDESSSSGITWEIIKALLMDMILASGASPCATIWTMTALMKAPKVMEKLQHEIRSLVGQKGKVDEDDLPKLPYLKAVINESLRLYPPAPLLLPRETRDASILDGYEIGPKTMVYVNAYAVGRDPEYWESPNEFIPERFLNSDIDSKGQDFGLIPFGSGRRICAGMSLGYITIELMVANLVYNFDWELPKGTHAQDLDTNAIGRLVAHKKNALILVPTCYGV
ncbi:6,7,8-trihydroxycoumarin synthase-like [Salvia hispanica]|uniref:6,7,8-trihydroxycoumarin synthase-like n=1 Tax=Salvia hispanica TaxID=49212 RepID=UPI0020093FB5|nr:6,7,8-trihydroxycoumarin synthase-like [Salvia hispanica]